MIKTNVKLCVVLPVGPNNNGTDAIKSIQTYATNSKVIIVVDDSNKPTTKKSILKVEKNVVIIKAAPFIGLQGNLWIKLAQGYKFAIENYNFDVLLRMDTDALLIGYYPEKDAINYFKKNPDSGIIGSYRIDCNNQKRSRMLAAALLIKETSVTGIINPELRKALKILLRLARPNGYLYGESCMGGAVFQNYKFTHDMYKKGWLVNNVFKDSKLEEDHIFGLMAFALGYKLSDFVTGSYPMGLRHRGLPDSPENLVKRQKKIIHSTKFWQDEEESSIISFFAKKRAQDKIKAGHNK
jgi:hypothetical protein